MEAMHTKPAILLLAAVVIGCSDSPPSQPSVDTAISLVSGDNQVGTAGTPLANPLVVAVGDAEGNPIPGVAVTWSVTDGGGAVTPTSSTSSDGRASATFTLGPTLGDQHVEASVPGASNTPVLFTARAEPVEPGGIVLRVAGGGNNVEERYSSDLWVHGNYAYTGTWGDRAESGDVLKVWSLGAGGAPTLVNSINVPAIGTVSDVQVSDDGQLLVLSGERGNDGGIYLYSLADPANPSFLSSASVGEAGVHTVTLADIDGRRYAFASRNPGPSLDPADDPAMLIYDVTDPEAPTLVKRIPYPERNYSIHDTFVRDGIAFAFVWNDPGLVIYDVGNGLQGGSPSNPVELSRLVTSARGICCGPSVHNGWWFHNPVSGERRYLFVGQEGLSIIGSESSGDIHVVDVSDLSNPVEVAFFHMNGAGTHNFWMDEERQILYAAYYNGGVIALDVSGTLSGNLANRLISQVKPGGQNNTFTWGVQLANGFLYAIDMVSGLWQLTTQ
jgi:hypothetical protein